MNITTIKIILRALIVLSVWFAIFSISGEGWRKFYEEAKKEHRESHKRNQQELRERGNHYRTYGTMEGY